MPQLEAQALPAVHERDAATIKAVDDSAGIDRQHAAHATPVDVPPVIRRDGPHGQPTLVAHRGTDHASVEGPRPPADLTVVGIRQPKTKEAPSPAGCSRLIPIATDGSTRPIR